MATEIQAQERTETGKGGCRRVRLAGNIPAVVYAGGKSATNVAVEPRALRKALAGPLGRNTLLALALPGGKRTVLVKDLQVHPVAHTLTHADFLEVDVNVPVRIEIPVVLTGKNKAAGAGAVIEQVSRTIRVMVKANEIPEKVEVDISTLEMGSSIHVRDVKLPASCKLVGKGDETVAALVALREEKVEEKAADAAAVAGAAAAPGAAGAAPAAGAAAPAAGAAAGAKPAAGAAAAKPAAAAPAKK